MQIVSLEVRYNNNPKYWDRHAQVNNVDPDQMP